MKQTSQPGESEADFRIRLLHAAREERDRLVEKLRRKYATNSVRSTTRFAARSRRSKREKQQKSTKTLSTAVNIGTSILGAFFGRSIASATNVTRAGSAIRSATNLAGESTDVRIAEEQYATLLKEREELNATVETEANEIVHQFDTDVMKFDSLEVTPRKTDTAVDRVALLWLPFVEDAAGNIHRAF